MIAHSWQVGGAFGPAMAALVLAAAGGWLFRRQTAWRPAAACLAVLAGWALAVPAPLAAAAPRTLADHLLLPALLSLLADAVVARDQRWHRWAATAATVLSAWWLARSAVARPEFWRVLFGIWAAAAVLRRTGSERPGPALAAALTVVGVLLLAGAPPPWLAVAAVLAAGCAAGAAVPPGLLAAGFGAVMLGSGTLLRGRVGLVDAGCLLALLAPAAVPWAERRLPRGAGLAAPVPVAVGAVGLAWVVVRVLR